MKERMHGCDRLFCSGVTPLTPERYYHNHHPRFFFFFLFGQTQNWRHDVEDAIVLSYICKVNGERRRNNKTWEKYIYLEKFLYIIDKSFVIIYLLFMNEVCGWIGLIYSWGYWEENFLKHFEWTNLYRKIRFYMK